MRYALLKCVWLSSHDDQKAVIETYADGVTNYILRTVPPGEEFTIREDRVIHAPCLIHLQKSTRATYLSLILNNHIAAFPHDGGAIVKTNRKRGSSHLWMIPPHKEATVIYVGEAQFEAALGRFPENWELDRVNCPQAGSIGHYSCGWCPFHIQPTLMCGCRNRGD